jgi:tRNA C32,U32 (ribose-2'-O)-methylase TrmJ
VIRAAGAAMRSTGATELVLVAPPAVLASLTLYKSMLARHGIKTTSVPMSLDILSRHLERELLGGTVTRSFTFACAAPALTRAA